MYVLFVRTFNTYSYKEYYSLFLTNTTLGYKKIYLESGYKLFTLNSNHINVIFSEVEVYLIIHILNLY